MVENQCLGRAEVAWLFPRSSLDLRARRTNSRKRLWEGASPDEGPLEVRSEEEPPAEPEESSGKPDASDSGGGTELLLPPSMVQASVVPATSSSSALYKAICSSLTSPPSLALPPPQRADRYFWVLFFARSTSANGFAESDIQATSAFPDDVPFAVPLRDSFPVPAPPVRNGVPLTASPLPVPLVAFFDVFDANDTFFFNPSMKDPMWWVRPQDSSCPWEGNSPYVALFLRKKLLTVLRIPCGLRTETRPSRTDS